MKKEEKSTLPFETAAKRKHRKPFYTVQETIDIDDLKLLILSLPTSSKVAMKVACDPSVLRGRVWKNIEPGDKVEIETLGDRRIRPGFVYPDFGGRFLTLQSLTVRKPNVISLKGVKKLRQPQTRFRPRAF